MYSDTLMMYHFDSRNNVLVEGYGAGSTPGRPGFESRDDVTNFFLTQTDDVLRRGWSYRS